MKPADHAPLRLQRAADPDTAPSLLAHLLADANLHVRRAAAQNPGVPVDTLDLLHRGGATADFTGTRPALPDSLDENEFALLIVLGEYAQSLAVRHPDATAAVLDELASSERTALRRHVARHPRTAADTLTRLAADADPAVRQRTAAHPHLPSETLRTLTDAGADPDLSAFAAPPDHSSPDFTALAESGPYARQLAARHPDCPANLLDELANDPHRDVRAAIAQNPAASPHLLAQLADLDDPDLRLHLARHPHLDGVTLEDLARDPDANLRARVAEHPKATPDLLARLALDGAYAVRQHVAAHPNFSDAARQEIAAAGSTPDLQGFATPATDVTAQTLDRLAHAGHWGRQLAARHPDTAPDTLAQLATHADPTLRETAAHHLHFPKDLQELFRRAGSDPDAQGYEPPQPLKPGDPDRLLALGPWARRLLARHPDATAKHLDRLGGNDDHTVRREAARHPNTAPGALAALAQDQAHDVRWTLARRADLTADLITTLAADPLPAIRLAALEHPESPHAIAQQLRFDLDEDVRNVAQAKSEK